MRRFFRDLPLRRITAERIQDYQAERSGLSNKTINLEVALLRQILKEYKQWRRVADDVKMLPKATKPARVMSPDEKTHLLQLAGIKPEWQLARCAAVLALNTTMRGCELKRLRWMDTDLFEKTLVIQRQSTKTAGGNRVIPLNRNALLTLAELLDRAKNLGSAEPHHYVFPACENGLIDPNRPMTSWPVCCLEKSDQGCGDKGPPLP